MKAHVEMPRGGRYPTTRDGTIIERNREQIAAMVAAVPEVLATHDTARHRELVPQRPAEAITAAGRRIGNPDPEYASEARRKRQEAWQERTWDFLDEIPEVGRYGRYLANAFSRLNLFVGVRPAPGVDPIPLEDGGDTELGYTAADAVLCAETLEALTSPEGGQAEIMRRLGFQFAIPGEAYLVGRPLYPDAETERWDVYSVAELKIDTDTRQTIEVDGEERSVPTYYLTEPGRTTGGKQLPAETYVARLWRPHPQYSEWADSAMRSAGAVLDELLILTRAIKGAALSRAHGPGYLFLPNSMRGGGTNPNRSDADGQAIATDPTVTDMIAVHEAAIADPSSPASQMPLVIWVNDDVWRDFSSDKLVQFDRAVDAVAAAQRGELIGRFASAIDVPAEILTGIGDMNHWGAWQIPEDAFRSDIEPTVIMADAALTTQYLIPKLVTLGMVMPERFVIWHDATGLVSHPNKTANSQAAHDAIAISDDRYRRDLGYSDDDAPEPDEVARRIAIELARAGKGSVPFPAGGETVVPGPPEQAAIEAVSMAAQPVLDLGDQLAAMDYSLLLSVQQMADAAMHRALERANSRLRSLAAKDRTARPVLDRVPAASLLVAATLGPALVERLAGNDEIIGAAAFASLEDRYRSRLQRVSDETILLAGKDGELDDAEAEQLRQEYADARDPSWTILLAALLAESARLLFRPEPEGPPGEVDGALVSAGVVRDALVRAGGGGGAAEAGGVVAQASSMLTGSLTDKTLHAAKLQTKGWVWRYGDASLRVQSFEPHRRLDGKTFVAVDSERLANPHSFPHSSHYWPGDHKGCLCLVARTIVKATPVAPAPRFL